MGISRKQLVPTTALTGTAAAVYTVPNLVQAQVTAAVAINTAAVLEPEILKACARKVGSQAVVMAMDVKREGDGWAVYTHGGRNNTGKDAIAFARRAAELGAGEILLAKKILADGRRVDDPDPKVQEVALARLDRDLGTLQLFGGLGHRDAGFRQRAQSQKLVPGRSRKGQAVDAATRRDQAAPDGKG